MYTQEQKCIFTIIFILAAFLCKAQSTNKAIVLISETKQGNDIFLNYQDAYNDIKSVDFRLNTMPQKMQDIKLELARPILLEFNASFKQYLIYAIPGDTIYINSSAKNDNYYKFNEKKYKAHQVNFFNYLDSVEYGYGMGYPDAFGREIKASNYINNINLFLDKYNKRTDILNEYNKSYQLDAGFYEFAKSLIKQYYIQSLLAPYWGPAHDYNLLPQDYVMIINRSPLHELLKDDKWVYSSPTYRAMLVSYVRFLSRSNLYTPQEFQTSYRNAVDSLNGRARDYVLFYLMKDNINSGLDDFERVYKKFHIDCTSREYSKYVDSLVAKAKGLVSVPKLLNTQLENKAGTKITWGEILSKNKGNVLYIDLWASWCGPCLAQMPFSKKMENKLVGKPVKFLSISIDNNKSSWLKALQSNLLNGSAAQNYLLNAKSNLAIYLNAPPVPQYVLIDKKGVPISLKATRPDDPKTLKRIIELIK